MPTEGSGRAAFGSLDQSYRGEPSLPQRSRRTIFTSTKVPWFAGLMSWDQYRQVFDAICGLKRLGLMRPRHCNCFHIWQADALNVALLVPASRRASRIGLVRCADSTLRLARTDLADYQRANLRRSPGRLGRTHEGLWGYGPPGMPSVGLGSVYDRAG